MIRDLWTGVLRKAARHHCSKPFAMRNPAPLVSLTFDDVPDTAYLNGAPILERHGVCGTFYVASGTCGGRDLHWNLIHRAQVRALHDSGHEIGCHTFSHVRVDRLDASETEEECRRNGDTLRELCPGIQITNFCYPFGRVSLPRKLQLQKRFSSCRSIYEGINTGVIDLGMLRVIELQDRTLTRDRLRRVLRETLNHNGWLIFYTHDVAESPSWIGCSPALLRETLQAVKAEGMPCLSIRQALDAIRYEAPVEPASVFDRMPTMIASS